MWSGVSEGRGALELNSRSLSLLSKCEEEEEEEEHIVTSPTLLPPSLSIYLWCLLIFCHHHPFCPLARLDSTRLAGPDRIAGLPLCFARSAVRSVLFPLPADRTLFRIAASPLPVPTINLLRYKRRSWEGEKISTLFSHSHDAICEMKSVIRSGQEDEQDEKRKRRRRNEHRPLSPLRLSPLFKLFLLVLDCVQGQDYVVKIGCCAV